MNHYHELEEEYLRYMNENIKIETKDAINPSHYKSHPSGIECINITRHMNFCLGNAIKYIWRAGLKDDKTQDLEKAIWYLQKEIENGKD